MTDLGDMLKEVFLGDGPFDPDPSREAIEASVKKHERRMTTVRFLMGFVVTLMFGLSIWMAVLFVKAPADTSPKMLILYATIFLFGNGCVSFAKMWFGVTQYHIATMKELKRMQLLMMRDRG